MIAPLLRLGDVIDDYCPRCKLLLNHAVASMVGGTVVKVVCQTCHTEHPFKNAEVPPKKKVRDHRRLYWTKSWPRLRLPQPGPESVEKPPEPEVAAEPRKKKRAATPARYITRHAVRPPRGSH